MNQDIMASDPTHAWPSLKINPRWRPAYHIAARRGWLNDPNGVSWFAGEYHIFYQHDPYSIEWGLMHWGQVISNDLVHWRHAGIALTPGDPFDQDGCYSGSAVDNDGEFTLIYTGHLRADRNPDTHDPKQFTQNQNIAMSRDGVVFEKYSGNPVIPDPPEDSSRHFRDPKVWRHADRWYMILGNKSRDRVARAILYRSSDLRTWEYLGSVAESDGSLGYMWECPDFFELDGRHVLLISSIGMRPTGDDNLNKQQTGALVGSFDYTSHRLVHGKFAELDRGHDFYAFQTTETPDGRRIGVGWMDMWLSAMPEQADGWAGALTLPRELQVTAAGRVTMRPPVELDQLRVSSVMSATLLVDGRQDMNVEMGAAELLFEADLTASRATRIGFGLETGSGRRVTVYWDRTTARLELDRGGADGVRRAPFDPGDHLQLRVFVDRSSIEVFTSTGVVTMTSRIYPVQKPTLHLVSEGGATPVQIEIFDLEDIWSGQPADMG